MTSPPLRCLSCEDPSLIFVYGSNELGHHGAGAALHAYVRHGAKMGQGFGLAGRSFGVPTKGPNLKKALTLPTIQHYVRALNRFANHVPDRRFFVTRLGTGLAGYTDEQIAPFFEETPANCILPERWIEILGRNCDPAFAHYPMLDEMPRETH